MENAMDYLLLFAGLLVVVILLGMLLLSARRRLQVYAGRQATNNFQIEDLEEMVKKGLISKEEFRALRMLVL